MSSPSNPIQRLRAACALYDGDEATVRLFRARQIHAALRLGSMTTLANCVNVVVILAAFWNTASRLLLVVWVAAVLAVVWRSLRARRGVHADLINRGVSARTVRKAALHAAVLAGLWGLMPLLLMPQANAPQQLLAVTIATGMICAGGFALATLPWAATSFVVVLGSALTTAMFLADYPLAWASALLIVVYSYIVVHSAWSSAKTFGANLMAESRAEQQREVISLLLRDFEQDSSDVLWEVNRAGVLKHVSPRLASLLQIGSGNGSGNGNGNHSTGNSGGADVLLLRELSAVTPDTVEALEQLAAISLLLQGERPFRDEAFFTLRNGQQRCWSLTARPLVDAAGALVGWRGVASEVTDAYASKQQLMYLAHFDALTGLLNRHRLRKEVDDESAKPGGRGFALFCMDLDHFKNVNDTLGHAVGDGLLQEVARRLRSICAADDLVARLGGDEFALVFKNIGSAAEAEACARRLIDCLAPTCEIQGASIGVRASVGIALAPQHGANLQTLLGNADLAMYAAKASGRGTYQVFSPAMAAKARRRVFIENELREALARGQLSLAFQPQIAAHGKQPTGFEALIRWQHPTLGAVPAAEFIPIAEDAGLIQAIGEWVLRRACSAAAGWSRPLPVSVNISAVQAMSGNLRAVVARALADSGLPPHRLELEITESVFLDETDRTTQGLAALRRTGVRIALDDFGTGFSSMSYLRRFPFDTLKIDRCFVSEITTSRQLRAIVRMIIALSKTLGMQTVAEGVETEEQASVLARYQCDALQGYLFSQPMPEGEVERFLLRGGNSASHRAGQLADEGRAENSLGRQVEGPVEHSGALQTDLLPL